MASVPLCFIDTETTGVHPDRRAWEIALIRREPDGTQTETLIQILDVDLSSADPFGLKVGRFYERHVQYAPDAPRHPSYASLWNGAVLHPEVMAAAVVERQTRGAHLVGAVPNFDAEVFASMLRRHRLAPAWHYHLIDVEALAVGYLHGRAGDLPHDRFNPRPAPPWRSEDLSHACGVEPAQADERHTALGDARWAMRLYDAITTGTTRPAVA